MTSHKLSCLPSLFKAVLCDDWKGEVLSLILSCYTVKWCFQRTGFLKIYRYVLILELLIVALFPPFNRLSKYPYVHSTQHALHSERYHGTSNCCSGPFSLSLLQVHKFSWKSLFILLHLACSFFFLYKKKKTVATSPISHEWERRYFEVSILSIWKDDLLYFFPKAFYKSIYRTSTN